MRLLLDTHVLLWLLGDDPRLSAAAREPVTDPANEVRMSVVSLWEIAIKIRIGKLRADLAEIVQAPVPSGLFPLTSVTPYELRKVPSAGLGSRSCPLVRCLAYDFLT